MDDSRTIGRAAGRSAGCGTLLLGGASPGSQRVAGQLSTGAPADRSRGCTERTVSRTLEEPEGPGGSAQRSAAQGDHCRTGDAGRPSHRVAGEALGSIGLVRFCAEARPGTGRSGRTAASGWTNEQPDTANNRVGVAGET